MQSMILVSLVLLSLPGFSQNSSSSSAVGSSTGELIPSSPHVLYAPTAGLPAFRDWEIVVVSHSTKAETCDLIVYSADGKPFPSKTISLAAGETKRMDIRSILPEKPNGIVGGMAIKYFGGSMMIVAQITLRAYKEYGSLDVPFFEDMEFMSSELGAVWWEPPDGFSYLVLGNSSSDKISADVVYGSSSKEHVDLGPFSTVITPVPKRDDEEVSENGKIQSVHITSNGMAGTLRADGFAASDETGFLDTIRFFDPKTSMESVLYANGLHLSDGHSHLLVRNLTSLPIRISGELYPVQHRTTTRKVVIRDVEIPAEAARELHLPLFKSGLQVDEAAIRLQSSGPEGSFVAAFTNFDSEIHVARSVPFKDIGDPSISTGGYPWRLDGDYTSRVFITNVGKARAAFTATILPVGGKKYEMGEEDLDVGQTFVIDLKKLRDERVKDWRGNVLPRDATLGQLDWSTILGDGSERLIGRNEVISKSERVSSSFSCTACNCPYDTNGLAVNPYDPFTAVQLGVPVDGLASERDICNGATRQVGVVPGWTIATAGYFTLAQTTMTGVSPGVSGFTGKITGILHHFSYSGGGCTVQSRPVLQSQGTGTTQQPTSLSGPTMTKTTYTGTEKKDCYGQSENPVIPVWYGYQECSAYTVLDQSNTQIKLEGIDFDETIEVVSTNVGATTHSSSGATDSNFKLIDDNSLGSTTHAPAQGSYIVDKQTINDHKSGKTVRVNCLDYEYSDVTIKDITATPSTTCTRN